jgi:hypothetical protein
MAARIIFRYNILIILLTVLLSAVFPSGLSAQTFQYYMCSQDTFMFPSKYDNAFYHIDFGDGRSDSGYHSIKHIYSKTGDYKISIRRFAGTNNSLLFYDAHVGSLPGLSFIPMAMCSEQKFQNACADSILVNEGWKWDFGDGTTSFEKSPDHLYQSAGSYKVSLMYPIKNSCYRSVTKNIIVSLPKNAGFDVHINGTDALFVPMDSAAVSYQWNFGDSSFANSVSPEHSYKSDGKYIVSLLTHSNGCTTYMTDTISTSNAGIQPFMANSNVFEAYPNPCKNVLNIHYELHATHYVTLKFYDMSGKLVSVVQDGAQHPGKYHIEYRTSTGGLKSGTYLLKLVFGEVYLTEKVIIRE